MENGGPAGTRPAGPRSQALKRSSPEVPEGGASRFRDQADVAKRRRTSSALDQMGYASDLLQLLTLFAGTCGVCRTFSARVEDHEVLECPTLRRWETSQGSSFVAWRKMIKYRSQWHKQVRPILGASQGSC